MNFKEIIIVAVAAIIITALPTGCVAVRDYHIAKMVAEGADPISAMCSLSSESSRTALCILKAANK